MNRNEILQLIEQALTENLTELYLDDNSLTTLPAEIGELTNLTVLSIDNNSLTTLPAEIGELTNLTVLSLDNNSLTTLPAEIVELTNLTELYLHENADLSLPDEVLGARFYEQGEKTNPKELLEYYFRTRDNKKPLNEAKLILVGFGSVGKTSLVKRLISGDYDEGESKTDGIQISDWGLTLNGDEKINLNVWDFGGQEIMHSTHQFFLTNRSLYLLVLNGRQGHEDADAEYWLSLIESFGSDSPVVIVLNKYKDHAFDVNRRGLQQKYPSIKGFIETDCKENFGIDTLKAKIETETDELAHLRDAFPAAWFRIKDRIANMEDNFISFEHYRGLCSELGEMDTSAQESLAYYLHSLGIALNYREDSRLRDTHVLNPHWVTKGIYHILNADEKVAEQKGVLNVDDLAQILDSNNYPSEKYIFIFELMRKFELCFRFPHQGDRYLIPELLDKQQPAAAADFKPEECLNFQYHYPVLPEGILPRFIVSTHSLSAKKPRWKTGVILEFEKNQALVRADIQDKKVFISVNGPLNSRRRLLAVIRSDFERIHKSFSFEPKEIVPLPSHPSIPIPYTKLLTFERTGRDIIPIDIDEETVVDFNVQELLSGVDLVTKRRDKKCLEES